MRQCRFFFVLCSLSLGGLLLCSCGDDDDDNGGGSSGDSGGGLGSSSMEFRGDTYYMWDAKKWFYYGEASTIPTSSDADRWFNTVVCNRGEINPSTKNAMNSCKDMPNVNELAWYVKYGDPHWDNTTIWTLDGNEHKGGLWLLKKKKIIDNIKDTYPSVFSTVQAPDNKDWRIIQESISVNAVKGKPIDTKDYFFLPALGSYNYDGGTRHFVGEKGTYWSSSPYPSGGSTWSYNLYFGSGSVNVGTYYSEVGQYYHHYHRGKGLVAGHRPDGTQWFQ